MGPLLDDGLMAYQAGVSLLLTGALVMAYLWRRWRLSLPDDDATGAP